MSRAKAEVLFFKQIKMSSIKILVYLQGLFLFIFPIYWISFTCFFCDSGFKAPSIKQDQQMGTNQSNKSIESTFQGDPNNFPKSKNNHNIKNKYILYLNWREIHRERKTVVIQNKYSGEYGMSPFKGETRLIDKAIVSFQFIKENLTTDNYFVKIISKQKSTSFFGYFLGFFLNIFFPFPLQK